MNATVVSCVYGGHHRFVRQWANAVKALDPAPERILLAGDKATHTRGILELVKPCDWQHPQAFYLNLAIDYAETEWVWIIDIDDIPMTDGLDGLEGVWEDVWQMGFHRSDGEVYIPPQLTAAEYLALDTNPFTGASAIRVSSFRAIGGYHDIALQDWGLWRRMAQVGMSFESSGRVHYHYMRHPETRGATELTLDVRAAHVAEMMESELAVH